MIDTADVTRFLLGAGLVTEAQGPFSTTAEFGRNVNWRLDGRDASYFVKVFPEATPRLASIFQLEITLAALCPDQVIAPLHFDPVKQAVAYPFILGSEDGVRALLNSEKHPEKSFIGISTCLKSIQAVLGSLQADLIAFKSLPWALTLDRPDSILLREISPAGLDVLRIIQNDKVLSETIDIARSAWTTSHIIHGDVRLANFLSNCSSWSLIDWELAQRGHPLWDISCLVASLLATWILSSPQEPENAADIVKKSVLSFDTVERCVNTLIEKEDQEFNPLMAQFVCVRLVQNAVECCEEVTQIPIPSVLLLQVAQNIALNPGMLFRISST